MAGEEEYLEDDDFEEDELLDSTESEADVQAEEDLLLKGFKQHGFEFPEGLDGKSVAANIREMARRMQSMPSDMELSEMREAKSRYQQERETPRQAQEQESSSGKAALSKPSEAEQYAVWNEDEGMYTPKSKSFPNLPAVEAMNKWHQQVESRRRMLLENPEDYFKTTLNLDERLESVKKAAKEEALQEFNRQVEAQRIEADRGQFWEKHAGEIYVTDEKGYVKEDPFSGAPVLNKKGLKFMEFQGSLFQKYPNANPVTVEREAYEMADKWDRSEKRRQSKASGDEHVAETPAIEVEQEEVAETQKQSYTKRARAADESGKRKKGDRVLNRDASVVNAAKNGTAQNGGSDFQELWKSNLKAAGLT